MAQSVAFYVLMHQPWRFRLPVPALDESIAIEENRFFDEAMNTRYFAGVAERSYIPMLTLIEELLGDGFRMNIGLSWSFWEQALRYGPPLVDQLHRVLSHPSIEIVGVDPYHSMLPLIDPAMFSRRMRWMQARWQKLFGKAVKVTDTTEMLYSDTIYWTLCDAGFDAMLLDGRPNVVGAQGPQGVYQGPGAMSLIARHWRLSDDVGYRFSNRSWDGYPLMAPTYAKWIHWAPGPMVMVGWDFETFGEHHRASTGIFDFMRRLPEELERQNVTPVLFQDVLKTPQAGSLTPPVRPTTWAGEGDLDFFLGNSRQWRLYLAMQAVYHKAKRLKQPHWIDLAMRLMQSDHLHMLHGYTASGPEKDVSQYFTPGEWWALGEDRMFAEIDALFVQFAHQLDTINMVRAQPTQKVTH